MTGSKGVGRLAVQFLTNNLELRTVSEADPNAELVASVDWSAAVQAGELTSARARYKGKRSAPPGGVNETAGLL